MHTNPSNTIRRLFAACTTAVLLGGTCAHADLQSTQLEVVLGIHTDNYTVAHTRPFFDKELAERSGGKITARAAAHTELGLAGPELMKLLTLGTYDITYNVISYAAGDSPATEGIEMIGLIDDLDTAFKALAAYRPIIDREYARKFNARPIFTYLQTRSQIYCKFSEDEAKNFTLATLKGKRVRGHSRAFADYVESFGMVPVIMPFADVVPAMERGALDCGSTSSNAAYGGKWGQVANYVVDIPILYATILFAINLDTWNGLNADTQAFLDEQFKDLETRMAQYAPKLDQESLNCLLDGPCTLGEPAKMGFIAPNAQDSATLKTAVQNVVLKRWAERCGKACADEWNATLSGIVGMTIKTP